MDYGQNNIREKGKPNGTKKNITTKIGFSNKQDNYNQMNMTQISEQPDNDKIKKIDKTYKPINMSKITEKKK